jgi:hypothetical protein
MSRFLQTTFVALALLLSFVSAAPASNINGSTFHAEQAKKPANVSGYRNAAYFVNWYELCFSF